jgi:prepilin-type N-terminal cleavage/methylation domain-containing protein
MCKAASRHSASTLHPTRAPARRGVSLVEMMVASTVVSLIVLAMATMASGVRTTQRTSRDLGIAVQHARAILERIRQKTIQATANLQFHGLVVFSQQVGSNTFPDTLVVWYPSGAPAAPDGLPLWKEVVIYSPDPSAPQKLLEITLPGDSSSVPPLSDLATWQSRLSAAKNGMASQRLILTDRLRTALPQGVVTGVRGVIRFDAMLRPSDSDWNAYIGGSKNWEDLPWVLDIYSSQNGLRQNWCRIDMQLRQNLDDNSADAALPFLGSVAVYFQVQRP